MTFYGILCLSDQRLLLLNTAVSFGDFGVPSCVAILSKPQFVRGCIVFFLQSGHTLASPDRQFDRHVCRFAIPSLLLGLACFLALLFARVFILQFHRIQKGTCRAHVGGFLFSRFLITDVRWVANFCVAVLWYSGEVADAFRAGSRLDVIDFACSSAGELVRCSTCTCEERNCGLQVECIITLADGSQLMFQWLQATVASLRRLAAQVVLASSSRLPGSDSFVTIAPRSAFGISDYVRHGASPACHAGPHPRPDTVEPSRHTTTQATDTGKYTGSVLVYPGSDADKVDLAAEELSSSSPRTDRGDGGLSRFCQSAWRGTPSNATPRRIRIHDGTADRTVAAPPAAPECLPPHNPRSDLTTRRCCLLISRCLRNLPS